MTVTEITCVVPTFESPDLVTRCLTSILGQRDVSVEIIVSDDSRSDAVRRVIARIGGGQGRLRYAEGARSGNPVENWNAGLDQARAPIHLVVHQDEFLIDPLYLRRAVDALSREPAVAAIAGVKVKGVDRPSRFALVAPIARRLPGARRLLPIINWVGPTAVFPFRAGPRFDATLVQLVDVEFYGRVLASGPVVRLPGVAVGSLGHHGEQITARIDARALAIQELAILASRDPPAFSPLAHALYRTAMAMKP